MFERIWVLTLLQLSNKSKRYEKHSKRFHAFIAIRTLIVLFMCVIMGLLIYFIKNLLHIPTNEYFIIAILIITQGLNIIVAIISLTDDLYHSKDNQLLFSYPVKSDEVFISKMIIYYIYEFIRNLYVILPILVGFGVINSLPIMYFINILLVIIILPLISVGIATLISIPAAYIKNFFKQRPRLTFVAMLIIIAFMFYAIYSLVSSIKTPIRIVQLYNQFIIALTTTLYDVARYGTMYTALGKFLFQINYILNFLIILGTIVVVITLNYFISKPVYFKLMSASYENTVKKNTERKPLETKTMFSTFLYKEFIIAKRTPNELISNYAVLLSLPFFMYILNYIYMGINRSTLGNQFVLIFNIIISLIIVTSSNTASASAITTEGYEFVLLKTAPYNTSKIAWAKITFNIFFTVLVIGISFIIFKIALPVFPIKNAILLFIFINLVNIGHIFSSFKIDILNPKLSDYAAQGSISNNDNVNKSLANGLKISLFFGVLSLISFIFLRDLAWFILIFIASIILVYQFVMFQINLNVYFEEIEY